MQRAVVLSDWTATYADPIQIHKGDPVHLTGKRDIWEGHCFLWAAAIDGREGWVPDTIVEDGIATANYSAVELNCRAGETLRILGETHGWAWCKDRTSRTGWVPLRCLSQPNTG